MRGRARRSGSRIAGEAGLCGRSWTNTQITRGEWGGQAAFSWLHGPSARPFTSSSIPLMAFNLKKVLKALLHSSSQPLAAKDIQAAFERFHRQAGPPPPPPGGGGPAAPPPERATP